jgi:hypothetical protein
MSLFVRSWMRRISVFEVVGFVIMHLVVGVLA